MIDDFLGTIPGQSLDSLSNEIVSIILDIPLINHRVSKCDDLAVAGNASCQRFLENCID